MLSDSEISWIVELEVKPQDLDKFKKLTSEMTAATSEENGVQVYERFIDEGTGKIIVYERYSDSNAAVEHIMNFREKFAERFSVLASRKMFLVFGSPSSELRGILGGLGAKFLKRMDGFSNFRDL